VQPEIIVHKESLDKARLSIVRWLSFRSRSRREAELYLDKKGFAREVSAALLVELQEYRYIDDLRFTEEHIQSCLGRGLGQIRVRSELKKKGIDQELIGEAIRQHFTTEQELIRVAALLKRRAKRVNVAPDHKWVRQQVAFLKGRGFSENVITQALKQYCRDLIED